MSIRSGQSGDAGRRFLISVGIGEFDDDAIAPLPQAPTDAERIWELMRDLGYERVLESKSTAPRADELKRAIGRWARRSALGPDDVVVVYFAGHGVAEEDRHYLLCRDSELEHPVSTGLASEDLCRSLLSEPLGHLLVIVDVCFADAGAMEVVSLAAELARYQREGAVRTVLASARIKQRAREGAFLDALTSVLARPRSGALQRYLDTGEITRQVNDHFERMGLVQQARLSVIGGHGSDLFFPNPAHLPGLRSGEISLEVLAQLRRQAHGHFAPRARGSDHSGEQGDYFTARTAALAEIATWLRGVDHDMKARVVTGNPGSGKSALLGRILDSHRPVRQARPGPVPDEPIIPQDMPVVVLHAHRVTVENLATSLGKALGRPEADLDEVLEVLSNRREPLVVVLDALDEAGTASSGNSADPAGNRAEAGRIARLLLQPLSVLPQIRLIVGTRRPQLAALGRAIVELDLDTAAYLDHGDVVDYAYELLRARQNPGSQSPYRDQPILARVIATAIAARAGTSFLVARLTARALVHGQTLIDTTSPGWQDRLPSDAGQAFAAYLDRYGPERPRVERLLRPLAYAQGAGLPWSTLWAPLATALSGVACTDDDIEWLHQNAGEYLVEATGEAGATVYRLFHETMAEHLRRPGRDREIHSTITETLLARIPPVRTGRTERAWQTAHPYCVRHLAEHAAAATTGAVDSLLEDVGFLTHADPASVYRALGGVTRPAARSTAALYRTSGHSHLTPTARRQVLAADAARHRHRLASAFNDGLTWQVRWAGGTLPHPAQRAVLSSENGEVFAVATTMIDDRPHAVTGNADGSIRVWNLTDGAMRAMLPGHSDRILAVVCVEIDGHPHAVTGSEGGSVRVWNLTDNSERSMLIDRSGDPVWAITHTVIEGRPHAVTGSQEGWLRVWDLTDGAARLQFPPVIDWIKALDCIMIDGRPHVVAGGLHQSLRMWDLIEGIQRIKIAVDATALECFDIEGVPYVVTGSPDGAVRLWNLRDGSEGARVAEHSEYVADLACALIDGHQYVVATGTEGAVRVWNVATGEEVAELTGHNNAVWAATCVMIDGRAHALTGSADETLRMWDLTDGTACMVPIGHAGEVRALGHLDIDGRPYAVTGGQDDSLCIWDLFDGTVRSIPTGMDDLVWLLTCMVINSRPYAIAHISTGVYLYDLLDGSMRTIPFVGSVWGIAYVEIGGRPCAVIGSDDERFSLQVWDLENGTELMPLAGHGDAVWSVACVEIGGSPHAVSVGDDRSLRVWNLLDGTMRSVISTERAQWTVVCTLIGGRPHAVTAGLDGVAHVWDLIDGVERAKLTGHSKQIRVGCTVIGGRPHAVTGGLDRSVRVWDLERSCLVDLITQTYTVSAVAAVGDVIVLCEGPDVITLEYADITRMLG